MEAERGLVAVSAGSNRQKADRGAAQWWVPRKEASCRCLTGWVSAKTWWELTVDQEERETLREHAAACADRTVTTTVAG